MTRHPGHDQKAFTAGRLRRTVRRLVPPVFFIALVVGAVGIALAPPSHSAPLSAGPAAWAPVGARPLSDAQAAARVRPSVEVRSANAAGNAYRPTDAELGAFRAAKNRNGETTVHANPLRQYVTGRSGLSKPSTDELIQWTAHKWGIPADVIRAQMAVESWWRDTGLGDLTTVNAATYSKHPARARRPGSRVYESMGLMQIKWRPDGSMHVGTEPLRWKSNAFNLDYYGATIRFFYDGRCSWCKNGYRAGQTWQSIGAWFAPYPWNNSQAQAYVERLKRNLSKRVWNAIGF